jgi:hypothetical protein
MKDIVGYLVGGAVIIMLIEALFSPIGQIIAVWKLGQSIDDLKELDEEDDSDGTDHRP